MFEFAMNKVVNFCEENSIVEFYLVFSYLLRLESNNSYIECFPVDYVNPSFKFLTPLDAHVLNLRILI